MAEDKKGNAPVEPAASLDDGADFFDRIEREVNSAIIEPEVTPPKQDATDQQGKQSKQEGSKTVDWDSDENPYKKRYSDSSREAMRLKQGYEELEPFKPLIDIMKQDTGLVENVQRYLEGGGKPAQSIKDELQLGDDFVFNAEEALTNQSSDSAKLLNAHVDQLVRRRTSEMINAEKQRAAQVAASTELEKEKQAFMKKYNMDDAAFEAFKNKAASHRITYEDAYKILEQETISKTVADTTKKDMINQMRSVRGIPTTDSAVNGAPDKQRSPDDTMMDILLGLDGGIDNLFG
jgi:hypothetical protein